MIQNSSVNVGLLTTTQIVGSSSTIFDKILQQIEVEIRVSRSLTIKELQYVLSKDHKSIMLFHYDQSTENCASAETLKC